MCVYTHTHTYIKSRMDDDSGTQSLLVYYVFIIKIFLYLCLGLTNDLQVSGRMENSLPKLLNIVTFT